MPPGLTIPSIFTAVDRFSAPLGRMRGALGSFIARSEVGLARVERGFRRILSPLTGFQNMLRGLGVYVGLFSLIMLFRSAVGIMADFEQAQINIKAVTGKSLQENKALSDQARVLALRYGQAAKSVLELDLALIKLGFSETDVMKMSKPIMTGSVALRAEPEELAKTTGAILQAMKIPVSQTQDVIDKLAKAADLSAMDWSDLQTMLPRAMQSASLAGLNLDQLLALFAMARNAQVHVASGSVAIKNMLIKGAIWNKDMKTMLNMIVSSPDKIKAAYKMFGSKTLVTALPLAEAQKLGDIDEFQKKLSETFSGYAEQIASVRLDSVRGRLTLFTRSYEEMVLAIDDGSGPFGAALKQYLDTASAMMLISAGSEAAKSKLQTMSPVVLELAAKYLSWLKIIGFVVAGLIALKIALIAWNAVLIISKVLVAAWSVVLGIAAAAGWANVFALKGNIIALGVLRGVVAIATAAQWLFNAAMAANPIGLIIVAIIALIAYVGMIISKWNEWGAALSLTLGTVGMLISVIITLIRHWDDVVDAFTKGGLIDGIKAIGKVIVDAVLYPIQQLLQIIGKIKGLSFIGAAGDQIEAFRNSLWADPAQDPADASKIITTNDSTRSASADSTSSVGVSIDINNKSGHTVKARSKGATINMKPESTFNFWDPMGLTQ